MQVEPTFLEGLLRIKPARHYDTRGFFEETWSSKAFSSLGIDFNFAQDNRSVSNRALTVRGLHFQIPPYAQAKLVRCSVGSFFDVAVDLRVGSPTFGGWYGEVLTQENGRQLLIPEGFAHGFLTLNNKTEISYKCSNLYSPDHERSIRFDDPDVSINWPIESQKFFLSEKDAAAPFLRDVPPAFWE